MLHAVGETARAAHHRHGAVLQAVHLVQATRLVQRRHQEDVTCRFDHVRQLFAVTAVEHGAPGELLLQAVHEALVLRLPAAECDEAEVVALEQGGQRLLQQVDAFLPREPRNHADERHAGRCGHAQQVEQRFAITCLARQVVARVLERQVAVGRGIPVFVIDAIEDATQGVVPRTQVGVETVAAFRRADFTGVRRADRGHGVGVQDAVPHRIDAALPEIGLMQRFDADARPDVGRGCGAENALVTDVVDREYAACRSEDRVVPRISGTQQQWRKRRVPVIAVHDVRRKSQALAAVERGSRQHQVADVFVLRIRIDEGPIEDGGAVHQLDPEVGAGQPHFAHVVTELSGTDHDRRALQFGDRPLFVTLQVRQRVQRGEDPDVCAAPVQVTRQRGRHVAEAAGLGEGGDLRRQETDAMACHGPASLPQGRRGSARSGWPWRRATVSCVP